MSQNILIITSRFNDRVTRSLQQAAVETLQTAGWPDSSISHLYVPGAFELPNLAMTAARSQRFAAIICLGCVIRGDTPHFDFVAGQAAAGIMRASMERETPVIFGVLTTDSVEQALNRSGLKIGNKGRDAALTAIEMLDCHRKLKELIET